MFLNCIRALRCEPIIQRSPRGKAVLKVIDELERMKSDDALTSVCTYLISQVYSCIAAGDQYKLPSTANGHMWSSFHKLRNSSDIERVWQSLNLQEAESHLCLQLIVDRLMKLLISNRVKARQTTATPNPTLLTSGRRMQYAVCPCEPAETIQEEIEEQACATQARSFCSSFEIHEGRTATIISQQCRGVYPSVV